MSGKYPKQWISERSLVIKPGNHIQAGLHSRPFMQFSLQNQAKFDHKNNNNPQQCAAGLDIARLVKTFYMQ